MIRSDRVKDKLFGGVGFRQPSQNDYSIVDEVNAASTSGLYFNDASNLVSIKNIKECQDDESITDDNFNTYLANLHKASIDDVCREVIAGQNDYLQSVNIYPYEKRFTTKLTTNNRFVGFEISHCNRVNIVSKISFIELVFDEDITLNVHLYNSNLKEPIKTIECECIGGQSNIFDLTDWFIQANETYKGGKFYVGYFESDLGTVKPYAKDWENSILKSCTNYYSVEPVWFNELGTGYDIDTRTYDSDTFGMNIGLDSYKDYTELIIRNRELFYPAIQYQLVVKVLNLIRTSNRSNGVQRIAAELVKEAEFELYGNKELGINGKVGMLTERINTIKKSLFPKNLIVSSTLI